MTMSSSSQQGNTTLMRGRTLQGYGGYSQHNQDSVFFQTRLCDNDERYLFGVCDGHGLDGH
jgi:serine/threonine protein phosphatase PrpC